MPQDTLYILSTPDEPPCPSGPHLIPARLSHRIAPSGQLLRLNSPYSSPGGILVVCGGKEPPLTSPAPLCSAILGECLRSRARGLFPDFEIPSPFSHELIRLLSPKLSRLGITLFLPELLAPLSPHCRILIPSALSGGSLALRLREAVEQYGADRMVLCLQPAAEDFLLPCPTGKGTPLTPPQLSALLEQNRPQSHFSAALCTHYFTYRTGGEYHLVLFDDDDCLCRKITCARYCGISRFFILQRDKQAVSPVFSPQ